MGRRATDQRHWLYAAGWFAHSVLLICCAIWVALLMSLGIASILDTVCTRNHSQSKVCLAVKGGLLTE